MTYPDTNNSAPRTTLHVRNHPSAGFSNSTPAKKKHIPRGHDAILAQLQESRAKVRVTLVSGEEFVDCVIKGRDKFTITLDFVDTSIPPVTVYKHAIESFGVAHIEAGKS